MNVTVEIDLSVFLDLSVSGILKANKNPGSSYSSLIYYVLQELLKTDTAILYS